MCFAVEDKSMGQGTIFFTDMLTFHPVMWRGPSWKLSVSVTLRKAHDFCGILFPQKMIGTTRPARGVAAEIK